MERMEAELNVLRTAAASGFGGGLRQQRHQHQHQHQHSEMSASSKDSHSQQLASPAPSGGGPSCDTCVLGKDCACLSAAVGDTSPPQQQSITIPQSPEQDLETTSKDDACGLCSSGSCLCQDLGLRDSAPKTSSSPSRPRSQVLSRLLLLRGEMNYPMEDVDSARMERPVCVYRILCRHCRLISLRWYQRHIPRRSAGEEDEDHR